MRDKQLEKREIPALLKEIDNLREQECILMCRHKNMGRVIAEDMTGTIIASIQGDLFKRDVDEFREKNCKKRLYLS
jgi:hypothetical protein